MTYADLITPLCRQSGLPEPHYEYVFAPPRKWRFDVAFPSALLAIEVQGGIWTHGRHTRGAALLKEHEKLNRAAELGWRIVYLTPQTIKKSWPAVEASVLRRV